MINSPHENRNKGFLNFLGLLNVRYQAAGRNYNKKYLSGIGGAILQENKLTLARKTFHFGTKTFPFPFFPKVLGVFLDDILLYAPNDFSYLNIAE